MSDKPLSPKELFCLRYLAKQDATTFNAAKSAIYAGINNNHWKYEWADAPFRSLRKRGLICNSGKRLPWPESDRALYTITDAGREALRRIDEVNADD